MAVTRSTTLQRTHTRRTVAWRRTEALWLLAATVLVACGFYLVYAAKTRNFPAIDSGLANKQLLNLNDLAAREDLLPYLAVFPETAERRFAARRIYDAAGALPNVGALARLRVSAAEIENTRGLKSFQGRRTLLTG